MSCRIFRRRFKQTSVAPTTLPCSYVLMQKNNTHPGTLRVKVVQRQRITFEVKPDPALSSFKPSFLLHWNARYCNFSHLTDGSTYRSPSLSPTLTSPLARSVPSTFSFFPLFKVEFNRQQTSEREAPFMVPQTLLTYYVFAVPH